MYTQSFNINFEILKWILEFYGKLKDYKGSVEKNSKMEILELLFFKVGECGVGI